MSKYTDAIRELAKKKALDAAKVETLLNAHEVEQDGGPGSGNFGHRGRPGKKGGSAPRGEGGGNYGHMGRPGTVGGPSPTPAKKPIGNLGHTGRPGMVGGQSEPKDDPRYSKLKLNRQTGTIYPPGKTPAQWQEEARQNGFGEGMLGVRGYLLSLQEKGKKKQAPKKNNMTVEYGGKTYTYDPSLFATTGYSSPTTEGSETEKEMTRLVKLPNGKYMTVQKGQFVKEPDPSYLDKAKNVPEDHKAAVKKWLERRKRDKEEGKHYVSPTDSVMTPDPKVEGLEWQTSVDKLGNLTTTPVHFVPGYGGGGHYEPGYPPKREESDFPFQSGARRYEINMNNPSVKKAMQTFMKNGGLEGLGGKIDNKVREFEKGGGLTALAKKADQKINSFMKNGGTSKYGERADKAIQTFLQNGGMERYEQTGAPLESNSAARAQKALAEQKDKAFAWASTEREKYPEGSIEREGFDKAIKKLQAGLSKRPTPDETKQAIQKALSNISPKMHQTGVDMYKKTLDAEPKITTDICDVADELGVGLYDLANRIKSAGENSKGECRIEQKRKEYEVIKDDNGNIIATRTPDEAAQQLKDLVRYTFSVPHDTMGTDAAKVLKALEKKGYKIIKASPIGLEGVDPKSPYFGINCCIEKDGIKAEVQFHSPESYAVKNAMHKHYDIFRSDEYPQAQKDAARDYMYPYYKQLRHPKGVDELRAIMAKKS